MSVLHSGIPASVVALFGVLAALGAALVIAGLVPLKRRRDH